MTIPRSIGSEWFKTIFAPSGLQPTLKQDDDDDDLNETKMDTCQDDSVSSSLPLAKKDIFQFHLTLHSSSILLQSTNSIYPLSDPHAVYNFLGKLESNATSSSSPNDDQNVGLLYTSGQFHCRLFDPKRNIVPNHHVSFYDYLNIEICDIM